MARISEQLSTRLKTLPTSTGVYLFKNAQGKVIYIGKARNLRNRVRTYFQKSSRHDAKTVRLVSLIADFDLVVTENEVESLILEANLVHEHKPRYNIRLKDDKHFPYIKISNEPFPRVVVVRRLEKDGAEYFGPYTSSKSMRKTLELLTRLFKIRSCKLILPPPEGKTYKVCLDYHINRCQGPCVFEQTEEEYAEAVKSVRLALAGRSRELSTMLKEKMNLASVSEDYEKAKEYRDQIEALGSVHKAQHADIGEVVDRDIVSIARDRTVAIAVVLQIREGILIGRQHFQLTAYESDSERAILQTFLEQYYNNQPNLPSEILIPREIEEFSLLRNWLKELSGKAVKLSTPRIGAKVKLIDMAAANARLLLDELLIQKKSQADRTSKMVSSLQEELSLSFLPRSIVCFDISNTGETDAVGSCVFFENGKPKKSEYRHFKIKGVSGQDDFSMMREVIGRYFHRMVSEKTELPNLVVVDGGKGQLSSALAELKSLGCDSQPIIGLAKQYEEIYFPGRSDPITIPKSSPGLILLKLVRDEAHRFAVTYNRKVRKKRTIHSALDDIKGVGESRRTALLKKFGSVDSIKKASVAELISVKGISKKLAGAILKKLIR